MTSVKGDILSALSSTTRRILGGAAISAVLLGAGSGMAFADIDNSGAGSPQFGDQTNNGLAGDGGDGAASGDATGGDAAAGVGEDGDVSAAEAGGAESGTGGAGGDGGSVGPNSPTQNANNQQQICEINQTAASAGGDGDATGDVAADGGDGGDISQAASCVFNAYSIQQGAGSTYGVMSAGDHKVGSKASEGSEGSNSSKSSSEDSASAGAGSSDMTPVGAADTGDGSFVLASSSSDLGDQVAMGGAISAAALLGAYGISIARRRVAAHQA